MVPDPLGHDPDLAVQFKNGSTNALLHRLRLRGDADKGDIADPVKTAGKPGRINVGKSAAQVLLEVFGHGWRLDEVQRSSEIWYNTIGNGLCFCL